MTALRPTRTAQAISMRRRASSETGQSRHRSSRLRFVELPVDGAQDEARRLGALAAQLPSLVLGEGYAQVRDGLLDRRGELQRAVGEGLLQAGDPARLHSSPELDVRVHRPAARRAL